MDEFVFIKNVGTQTEFADSDSFCFKCDKELKNKLGLKIHNAKKHNIHKEQIEEYKMDELFSKMNLKN